MRVARLPVALLVLVCSLLLLVPLGVSAHAGVVATDPVDGARLPASPPVVSVTFNEPVTLAPGGLRVVKPDGSLADVGDEVDTGTVVSQAIEPLPDGWYVMAWSIVSEDGHVVHGSATFAVGDADAAARPQPSITPSSLETALWLARGLADLALLAGAGALFAWVALGARTRRVALLPRIALAVAAIGGSAWLLVEASDAGSAWLSTGYALSAITRLALVLLAVGSLLVRPARERLALLSSLLAVATLAVGGHAAGSPLTSVTLVIHLLAGVTWLGAAPAVALMLWDRSVPDQPDALGVVRGFSRTATLTLFLVILGGSASALLLTDGLASGITTYVWIVLVKLAVVALAALMGALGRRGLTNGAGRRHYRRLFLLDACLLVVVAALSSALTLVGPHGTHAVHGDHQVGSPRCAMAVGETGITVVADPGTPGTNTLTVTGPAATVEGVTLELEHPYAEGAALEVPLTSSHHGWTGAAAMPFTGTWTATVRIRVDTFTEASGSCDLTIAP
ncbi:MAG: copper resistance protein CopC [Candidatus Limnocylindrales bacterium]